MPEAPQQAEQKQAPQQSELPDQLVLGVTPPGEFLAEGEGHGDQRCQGHLQQKVHDRPVDRGR
jgi:hypothetical protein